MALTVDWTGPAGKDLKALGGKERTRIIEAVEKFAATGYGDVKALQDCPGEFRLRVGNYRVRFGVDHANGRMTVLRVLDRKEAYRR